jgi:pimeloyl-ACP methyl ester carboxylesterase
MMINRRDAVTWQRVRDSGLSMRRGARAVRALRRFDYWTAVRSIRCPILLINGGHDWLFRSGEGGTVLAARDARLAVLPGAGHLAPLHRRAEVSVLIRGFAARIDGPKADRPARSPRAGVRRQPRG